MKRNRKRTGMLAVLCGALLWAACGTAFAEETSAAPETEAAVEWPRDAYFFDESEHMLSMAWLEDTDEPGWYVGCVLGEDFMEDSWGGVLSLEEDVLHGTLPSAGSGPEITVTVRREGDEGAVLEVEGGETYHFTEPDFPDATIFVNVNVDGFGRIAYAEGEETPEIDSEFPAQSAVINLAEPAVHTFLAWPDAGNLFVKWQKDGEDFSEEPQITVLLEESADYVAVFEEDPDWQNPVMNFVGEYRCGDLQATVECFGNEDAWIRVVQETGENEVLHWDLVGRLDTDTLTIAYSGCAKSAITYNEDGEAETQVPEYEDGTGTVTFHEDGTFTWHDDQTGEDMVFEWAPEE